MEEDEGATLMVHLEEKGIINQQHHLLMISPTLHLYPVRRHYEQHRSSTTQKGGYLSVSSTPTCGGDYSESAMVWCVGENGSSAPQVSISSKVSIIRKKNSIPCGSGFHRPSISSRMINDARLVLVLLVVLLQQQRLLQQPSGYCNH